MVQAFRFDGRGVTHRARVLARPKLSRARPKPDGGSTGDSVLPSTAVRRCADSMNVGRTSAGTSVVLLPRIAFTRFVTPITAQALWPAPASPEIAPADPGGCPGANGGVQLRVHPDSDGPAATSWHRRLAMGRRRCDAARVRPRVRALRAAPRRETTRGSSRARNPSPKRRAMRSGVPNAEIRRFDSPLEHLWGKVAQSELRLDGVGTVVQPPMGRGNRLSQSSHKSEST